MDSIKTEKTLEEVTLALPREVKVEYASDEDQDYVDTPENINLEDPNVKKEFNEETGTIHFFEENNLEYNKKDKETLRKEKKRIRMREYMRQRTARLTEEQREARRIRDRNKRLKEKLLSMDRYYKGENPVMDEEKKRKLEARKKRKMETQRIRRAKMNEEKLLKKRERDREYQRKRAAAMTEPELEYKRKVNREYMKKVRNENLKTCLEKRKVIFKEGGVGSIKKEHIVCTCNNSGGIQKCMHFEDHELNTNNMIKSECINTELDNAKILHSTVQIKQEI